MSTTVKVFYLHLVLLCLLGGMAAWGEPTTSTARRLVVTRANQTLEDIARGHFCDAAELRALNPGLTNPDLRRGDAVVVPVNPLAPPALHAPDIPLRRGPRGRKQVALTIDAAWVTPEQLDTMLETLARHEVRTTFFLTGIFLRNQPEAPRRIVLAGHVLGNHSDTHPHFTEIEDRSVLAQLEAVENRVRSCGTTTRPWWRPPYGDRDSRVDRLAARGGYRGVLWTIDSLDWYDDPPATADGIFERVCVRPFEKAKEGADPLDGAIVLFHAAGKVTPAALDRIIPGLRAEGYALVTLGELLTP